MTLIAVMIAITTAGIVAVLRGLWAYTPTFHKTAVECVSDTG